MASASDNTPIPDAEHAADVYRPGFHFTPPSGWMNDPNGLVFYEGQYHLFYQHLFPSHWGHAVGTDLVHWTHLPIAFAPDERGLIASGSAVVDWQDSSGFFAGGSGLVAIFTHWRDDAQEQSIAYSTDNGRSWTKYSGNPVVPNPGIRDFRDPKVLWHGPTVSWVMLLAVYDRVHFYTSPDLKNWQFASEFGATEGSHDGVWECPDLFELPVDGAADSTKWTLHVSINSRSGRTMQYFVGKFDGRRFVDENAAATTLWTDYGADYYAAVSWFNLAPGDSRRVWIGWMNNWRYGRAIPTAPWQGALSIPRQLGLSRRDGAIRLVQQPIAELATLRRQEYRWRGELLAPEHNPLAAVRGKSLEIDAEFTPATAQIVGFKLRCGRDQFTTVGYDVRSASLFVDRTNANAIEFHADFAGKHEAPLQPADGRIKLRIFLDECSVEVFAGDGAVVLTDLIFPDPANDGLEVFATGGEATLESLIVYTLAPAQAQPAPQQQDEGV